MEEVSRDDVTVMTSEALNYGLTAVTTITIIPRTTITTMNCISNGIPIVLLLTLLAFTLRQESWNRSALPTL